MRDMRRKADDDGDGGGGSSDDCGKQDVRERRIKCGNSRKSEIERRAREDGRLREKEKRNEKRVVVFMLEMRERRTGRQGETRISG